MYFIIPVFPNGNLYGQNAIDPGWNSDRYVSIHLPEALPTRTPTTIFDTPHVVENPAVLEIEARPPNCHGGLRRFQDAISSELA